MYENITYESVLQRMLDKVPAQYDKREGSIMMNVLAPCAMELFLAYTEMDRIMRESFADTQSRDFLILRARERGLEPKGASPSHWAFTFNIEVDIGKRFSVDEYSFCVYKKLSNKKYEMVCEQNGSGSNILTSDALPLDYIEGLESVEIDELLVLGEDEEDTESLRKRYFEFIDSQPFGGNVADYKEKARSMDGVGEVKVIPIWNGPGTVKIIFSSSENTSPTTLLVSQVQNAFDPDEDGEGLGLAPIGHKCTVKGVKTLDVDISFNLEQKNNEDDLTVQIENCLDELFETYIAKWGTSDGMTIRLSQIEAKLFEIEEIEEIRNLKINDEDENLFVPSDTIPKRGDVDATVTTDS